MTEDRYLPALRFRALTRFFDPLVRRAFPEQRFKRRLLEQARIGPGQRVLDLGCGTGTLAIMAQAARPDAEVLGLDADPEILGLAREKAEAWRRGSVRPRALDGPPGQVAAQEVLTILRNRGR